MKRHSSRLIGIGLLGLILIGTMACAIGVPDPGNNQGTQEALQQTQVALSVQQTLQAMIDESPVPSAEATGNITVAPPSPEPTEPNLCAGKTVVDFQGVSFCYPAGFAVSVNSELASEIHSDMSENFNEPWRYYFQFMGYAVHPAFHTPLLQVYPVQEYIAVNPLAANGINDLNTFLQTMPTDPASIPFLPTWNAAQLFNLKVDYLTFQNGHGVRFLTQYGQAYWPVNNHDLFYTFQGITNDGQYYISAVLPISHPLLPATGDDYPGDINLFGVGEGENFINYIADIKTQLNPQPENSFTPGLDVLDAMIESLNVTP